MPIDNNDNEISKGDLISREWVKNNVLSLIDPETRYYVKQKIDNAPTVAVTDYDTGYQDGLEAGLNDIRPKGEWIRTALYGQTCLECNQCGKADFDIKYDNFCPNCGADMRKAVQNDT